MHARNLEIPAFALMPDHPLPHPSLKMVCALRPGQHFIRPDSPSEVLALLTFASQAPMGGIYAWAVVINVTHDSEGYVPGQLLKLRRGMHVRVVHEARPAHYALEQ